jgi:hypothetical protein
LTRRAIAHDAAITWIAAAVVSGVVIDGRSLTVIGVIRDGIIPATLITAAELWGTWRQNRALPD